jgi:hypothetical protein
MPRLVKHLPRVRSSQRLGAAVLDGTPASASSRVPAVTWTAAAAAGAQRSTSASPAAAGRSLVMRERHPVLPYRARAGQDAPVNRAVKLAGAGFPPDSVIEAVVQPTQHAARPRTSARVFTSAAPRLARRNTMPSESKWAPEAIRALGPTADLPTLGTIFGCSRWSPAIPVRGHRATETHIRPSVCLSLNQNQLQPARTRNNC